MQRKVAVLMVVDGLRGDMVEARFVPHIAAVASQSLRFRKHRSVFPSATRVNSASIATGCYPANHRLAGNTIALDEGCGLEAVSVGGPEFRERWRQATGRTLHRPTLAERVASIGGAKIYSNSSAGAAHMQDPEGHGWLFHRSGSHAPGFSAIDPETPLDVTYDADGDRTTTARFCEALLADGETPLWVLWICEPDHSQHTLELGSPEHLAVLAGADECVRRVSATVARRRDDGDDCLFILCSDHGHETITEVVPMVEEMVAAGLKTAIDSTDVVLASSGMGAHIYTSADAAHKIGDIARWLESHPSVGEVYVSEALARVGQRAFGGIALAFSMAKRDGENRFGIRGLGAVAGDRLTRSDAPGRGQHGGLGRYETNPMLMLSGGDYGVGFREVETSAVDIAPTILRHLSVPGDGLDGRPLPG